MPTECFLLVCWVLMQLVKASDNPPCFYSPPGGCPNVTETCRCKRTGADLSLVSCCDIVSENGLKDGLTCAGFPPRELKSGLTAPLQKKTTALHLQNVTLDRLDVSTISWRPLISFSVTDSKIPRLMGKIDDSPLACLNLSSNSLTEIDHFAFYHLHSLAMLDLSYNKLTVLPLLNQTQPHFQIDISGNPEMQCNSVIDLMKAKNKTKNVHFRNENKTFCSSPKNFHWFNSTEKVSLEQLEVVVKVSEECPKTDSYACSCTSGLMDLVGGEKPKFTVNVDCSNKNLVELPPNLPPNTIFLNVSHNNITSLDLLSTDQSYHNIRMLHADYNRIDSIAKLEGTRFIDNFSVLSLRSNNLNSILTYILSNTFDRNWFPHQVNLGQNRVICNCSTAQTLKLWLFKNKAHIPDYDQVFCRNLPGRVLELDQNKVCPNHKDWTDYIYYIIAAEITMFLLLISKVTYDYWVFKTAGYLPWPASKMPKLPCDWVFET